MTQKTLLYRTISLSILLFLVLAAMGVPAGVSQAVAAGGESYLVQGQDVDVVARLVQSYGGQVTSRLEIVNGVGALLSAQAASRLRTEPEVNAVTVNARVQAAGELRGKPIPSTDYPNVVGADLVWHHGQTGAGVAVAVVDTGLSPLTGLTRGLDERFRERVVGWVDFVDGEQAPHDPNGHGSHVAGIIANTDVGQDGEWNGVAPGVWLVGVRVLNEQGFGTYEQVIQGIQWVVEQKDRLNIQVMNLSLVSSVLSPYWADPLNQAVTRAWAQGITVVTAAGNGGPDPMTVGVPGNNPYAITVGAFTDAYSPLNFDDDYLAPFSAAGPTLDAFVKPDLIAPGAHMVSTMRSPSYIARNHEANKISPHYFSMAGTSQSAAVVSGVAAQILAEHPDLKPNQVKFRLMYTALPWVVNNDKTIEAVYTMWQQGAGRLNAPDAVYAEIEGEANQGMDIWADLEAMSHYQGFTDYDTKSQTFHLVGKFKNWDRGYWAWDGAYGPWTGGLGAWSGGLGAWSGGLGAWSGGLGAWSGGLGAWSGGLGAWSGGLGAWSGGFGAWSGGLGAWSGSEPWFESGYAEAEFVAEFLTGQSPDASKTRTAIGEWVDEP